MDANPRTIGNPDAEEFTKRHARFYELWINGLEEPAMVAFNALRSWAWARCQSDPDFLNLWNDCIQDDVLGLEEMDRLAQDMKRVWHEQGLWDWAAEEVEELMIPGFNDKASATPRMAPSA